MELFTTSGATEQCFDEWVPVLFVLYYCSAREPAGDTIHVPADGFTLFHV